MHQNVGDNRLVRRVQPAAHGVTAGHQCLQLLAACRCGEQRLQFLLSFVKGFLQWHGSTLPNGLGWNSNTLPSACRGGCLSFQNSFVALATINSELTMAARNSFATLRARAGFIDGQRSAVDFLSVKGGDGCLSVVSSVHLD